VNWGSIAEHVVFIWIGMVWMYYIQNGLKMVWFKKEKSEARNLRIEIECLEEQEAVQRRQKLILLMRRQNAERAAEIALLEKELSNV
jgi:hypothetical protein